MCLNVNANVVSTKIHKSNTIAIVTHISPESELVSRSNYVLTEEKRRVERGWTGLNNYTCLGFGAPVRLDDEHRSIEEDPMAGAEYAERNDDVTVAFPECYPF